MGPDAVLYGIEINPAFLSHVRGKVHDSRFVPILGRAENLGALLRHRGVGQVDAIVSSLGLTAMEHGQRTSILEQAAAYLGRHGVLTQYQYVHASGDPNWCGALGIKRFAEDTLLREYFREVEAERVIWNLPPANVYTCRP